MHREEKFDMVVSLINAKAAVGIGDNLGFEPLHIACEMGHVQIARKLCATNANVSAGTKANITPLMIAVDQGMAYFDNNCLTCFLLFSLSPSHPPFSSLTLFLQISYNARPIYTLLFRPVAIFKPVLPRNNDVSHLSLLMDTKKKVALQM
jgi:ankyrin repeat protein